MAVNLVGRIEGVCIGRIGKVGTGKRVFESAFVKSQHHGSVALTSLGLEGDEQAYDGHGGTDMAVLLYPIEHYAYWSDQGLDLPSAGAFAENLTVSGAIETDVNIGDIFQITSHRNIETTSTLIQICQPRSPCFKIAARYGHKDLPLLVQKTGFTGYLARVLSEGHVSEGDTLCLVERSSSISVAEASYIVNVNRNDHESARRLLSLKALGSSTRQLLETRLHD